VAVTFGRGPRARLLSFVLVGSALPLSWVWDSLGAHARGMILAAYGVTVLGLGLLPELRTRGLLKRGARTQGTVVGAEEERSGGDHPSTTYHRVVRFTTADGRTVEFTSGVGFGRKPTIGGAVPVRYRRNDPEQAEIDRAYTWLLPAAFWLLGGLGLLGAAVVVYPEEPQVVTEKPQVVTEKPQVVTEEPQVAPAVVDNPHDPGTEEPVPEPEPPPPAKVATGRIGDKLTVYDRSGKAQLEVTITRLKFSTGDQADPPPEHGLYMGVQVEAHALVDEQYVLIEALVGGRRYDEFSIIGSTAFQPLFDLDQLPLNKGERASGWLVFDVPARHGQLVLLRNVDGDKVGVWTY